MPKRGRLAASRRTARLWPLAAVAALCVAVPQASAARLPTQGLYEGCPPQTAEACAARLESIRAAGFSLVLNYSSWYGEPAEILRYADAAEARGLRLIWPLNHPVWRGLGDFSTTYPDIAEGSDEISNTALIAHAVALVAEHPATWGFYIGDEAPTLEAGRVEALSRVVRAIAPDRPQLYVARPGVARLAPFAGLADIAGATVYPIGSGDPPVARAARSALRAASAGGAQTAMVLQAFSWSQYRPSTAPAPFPSARALRAMRDAAIRHADPAMILWYSYQDILRADQPWCRWQQLRRAAFAPLRPKAIG